MSGGGPRPDLGQALAWLESHVNLEAIEAGHHAAPTLERITALCTLLGDPQVAYPVIHITGTNGKGSVARMLTGLLVAKGLSVGTYTSPDLEQINERVAWNDDPISDEDLTNGLWALRQLEALMAEPASRFELLTACAFAYFADVVVDVAVVEVGLGGRWDATNVVVSQVDIVTNVSMDHEDILGPDLADIASEKAGIIKPGATLVLGETDPGLAAIFKAKAGKAGEVTVWEREREFACESNRLAHGGRVVDLRTPGGRYPEVFLSLHGAHQGLNAACALAGAEAFFATPLDEGVVAEALGQVTHPGRLEVVGHAPLVVLDGAHNPAGAQTTRASLAEEFVVVGDRIVVMGLLRGRDPFEMLRALGPGAFQVLIACAPPSPRAMPAVELAAAAEMLDLRAEVAGSVDGAVERALKLAGPDDMVLVTGSIYLVGAARHIIVG
ncbi:MAG: bifunctional folylpolyglutamate synthase/dihydrofolate synthase [Acidimicrobiales bacterium]